MFIEYSSGIHYVNQIKIHTYISALDRSAKMGSTHTEASIAAASQALPTDFLRKWSRSFVLSTNTPTDTAIMPKQRLASGLTWLNTGRPEPARIVGLFCVFQTFSVDLSEPPRRQSLPSYCHALSHRSPIDCKTFTCLCHVKFRLFCAGKCPKRYFSR